MRKISEIYAASVCFVALGFIAVYSMDSIYNMVSYSNPELQVSTVDYRGHESDASYAIYLKHYKHKRPANISKTIVTIAGLDDGYIPPKGELLTSLRKESWKNTVLSERRQAHRRLLRSIIDLSVVAVIFVIHWVLFRKFRQYG